MAGHSFGGIVALETARVLLQQGHRVLLTLLIDIRAPGTLRQGRVKVMVFFLRTYLERFRFHIRRFFLLPRSQRLSYVAAKLTGLKKRIRFPSLFPDKKGKREKAAQGTHPLKVTQLLQESGFTEEGFPGRLVLLKTTIPLPTTEQADYGWGRYARDGLEVFTVKGEHGNIMKEPYAREPAAIINRLLRDPD